MYVGQKIRTNFLMHWHYGNNKFAIIFQFIAHLFLGLQCLANTSRTVDTEMCVCPMDCNSLLYTTEISSEQLYPLYSQTFGLLSNKDNFLWKLDKKLQNAKKDKKLYEQKILKDNYDDIISSSSVVHFYFKERGIWKYSQEEVFGYTELVGKKEINLTS